ncbi:hypothetical protein [Polaromonas sp. CG_23.6]|uniref:hypothetical protein n=1 Tax=Polaromonas sp. CG_23.6 TaxID=2760709 RepID=UPI002476846E|nr:hypothetical protein [Polaromonas sp. CG_23.6]MDH6183580.1 hypothetical protein [Polaromonas sp. CG_23.6]
MPSHIKTPSGDLIARLLIQRVSHIPKRGVVVKDSFNHVLAYVALTDDALAIKVRDLFNEVVLAGRNAKQPDWSFLTPPAPAPAPAPAPVPVPVPVPVPAVVKSPKVAKSAKVAPAAKLPAAASDTTTTEA